MAGTFADVGGIIFWGVLGLNLKGYGMQFLVSLLCFCILMGTFWASFKVASRPLDYSFPPESASLAFACIGLVLMLCIAGLPFSTEVSTFSDRLFIAQSFVVAAFWLNWRMLQPMHQK